MMENNLDTLVLLSNAFPVPSKNNNMLRGAWFTFILPRVMKMVLKGPVNVGEGKLGTWNSKPRHWVI